MTARTGKRGQKSLGHECWGKAVGTGPLDRTAGTDSRYSKCDRTAGKTSEIVQRRQDKERWTTSEDGATRTGKT